MLTVILFLSLFLLVLGSIPTWSYSRAWGYFPSGLIGMILFLFVIRLLL